MIGRYPERRSMYVLELEGTYTGVWHGTFAFRQNGHSSQLKMSARFLTALVLLPKPLVLPRSGGH